jgi:hypothetical protein
MSADYSGQRPLREHPYDKAIRIVREAGYSDAELQIGLADYIMGAWYWEVTGGVKHEGEKMSMLQFVRLGTINRLRLPKRYTGVANGTAYGSFFPKTPFDKFDLTDPKQFVVAIQNNNRKWRAHKDMQLTYPYGARTKRGYRWGSVVPKPVPVLMGWEPIEAFVQLSPGRWQRREALGERASGPRRQAAAA